MSFDRTLLKKSLIFGCLIYFVTELMLRGMGFLVDTLRPEGVPAYYLPDHVSPYLISYFLLKLSLWLFRPFSRILMLLDLDRIFSLLGFRSWGMIMADVIGWSMISRFILKARAGGKLLISVHTKKIIQGRFHVLKIHSLITLIGLAVGLCLYSLVIWTTPPEVLGGTRNLSAIGGILNGTITIPSMWRGFLVLIATLISILAIASIPHGLFVFFTGQSPSTRYSCPHCGYMFFTDLPDPDTVFSCPECRKTIRRSVW